jgi:lysophospholipase L1-like esterase
MIGRNHFVAAIVITSALCACPPARAGAVTTYIALGDSLAFGETDFTHNPSFGDRGYVSLYANALAAKNGGVRPNVINLGVDGETSSTFFTGGPPSNGTIPGSPAPQLNLNYPSPAPTQNALLVSSIATEQAAGHSIGTVSVQLGANDLYVVLDQPGFLGQSPAQQQAELLAAIGQIQSNLTTLLGELKVTLPHANVLVMGYYNPYNADPSSVVDKLADPAIKALNLVLAGEAAAFGDRYVDAYTPFLGHELEYTYIGTGNAHPNDKGYGVIAGQMSPVPEPSSLLLLGGGAAGCLALHRCRRRAAVAE